jgi:hypothetical protein
MDGGMQVMKGHLFPTQPNVKNPELLIQDTVLGQVGSNSCQVAE